MEWREYPQETPNEKHIKRRTQFLVRGFYQCGQSKGDEHYQVTRLCGYFEDKTVMFEEPNHFHITHWTDIKF